MPTPFRGYPRRIDSRITKVSPSEYTVERGEGNTVALQNLIMALTMQDVEFYILCQKVSVSASGTVSVAAESRTTYKVKIADDDGVAAIFRGEMLEIMKGES